MQNLRWEKLPNDTVVREYRWDQQNRLVKELHGTHESAYEYDGASRRWRITEKESGTQTKQETFVWCGSKICQKRNGSTVVRSYFGQGFEESGPTNYFYTRDHLGSVREVVASDGTTVASRLSYDPWGKATETGSGALADFTYTGHYFDRPTGLDLTRYRAYDPSLGRWISRDPIGLLGGLNLYRHVNNSPVNLIDVDGLMPDDRYPGMPQDEIDAANEGAGWSVVAFGAMAAGAAVAGAEAVELAAWSALQRLGPVGRFVGALLGNTARGQIEKGNTAGKCGDVAKTIPGTLVQSPMGKVPHFARMSGDLVTDPTLRDNLKAYGRAFEDIPVGQTVFTKVEWDSLVARLPDIIRKSGE